MTTVAIRHVKFQSHRHYPTFYRLSALLRPTWQCQSTQRYQRTEREIIIHSTYTDRLVEFAVNWGLLWIEQLSKHGNSVREHVLLVRLSLWLVNGMKIVNWFWRTCTLFCLPGRGAVHGRAWNMRGCVRTTARGARRCRSDRLPQPALPISLSAGSIRCAVVLWNL